MSKYNRMESIPISSLSEQELSIAIREWAEGNTNMEKLLWICYQKGIETNGCHADTFPYISFYLDSKKNEVLKLLNAAQSIKGASFFVLPDGGNPLSGKDWNRPLLCLMFDTQRKIEIDFILEKLTSALISNRELSTDNDFFAQLLDLAQFLANKESGLNFVAFHELDDSYSFVMRAEKTNFEYYNSLMKNAELKLLEDSKDWLYDEWIIKGNEVEDLTQKTKLCITSIIQNYSLERPSQIQEGMSFNTIARMKKREFGDSLEGKQKFEKWLQEENSKLSSNQKKSYNVKKILSNGFEKAKKILHYTSEKERKKHIDKDDDYER